VFSTPDSFFSAKKQTQKEPEEKKTSGRVGREERVQVPPPHFLPCEVKIAFIIVQKEIIY